MWINKGSNSGYINIETNVRIEPENVGPNWIIRVVSNTSNNLVETYASQADAHDAIRRLVHGVDVNDVI